jgi:hypothetical protein
LVLINPQRKLGKADESRSVARVKDKYAFEVSSPMGGLKPYTRFSARLEAHNALLQGGSVKLFEKGLPLAKVNALCALKGWYCDY